MQSELKPCPFCGSDRVTVWNIRDGQQAVCKECKSTAAPTFHGPDGRDATWGHAIEAWNRRAALSEQERAVEVKALEWAHFNGNYPTWRTSSPAISFEALIDRGAARMYGEFPLSINGRMAQIKYDTLEAAKAAAQSAFEERVRDFIRSALVDVPAVEPVAGYRRRLPQYAFEHYEFEQPGYENPSISDWEPLYTSPPLSREGEDTAEVSRTLAFVARWAWREDPPNAVRKLTDAERLSAIKHHPTIKALTATRSASATSPKGCAE